jgi:low temperature requirement protein LtrA
VIHIHRPSVESLRVAGTSEGDRVTSLELFFDLVYVFAFTQVTTLMEHGHAPGSLVDGFIVLSLLWWSWCSYSWLANQARADEGVLRAAFIVAMVAVFIACLALPDAFRDVPGALSGAGVVVACYAVVRLTHVGVYLVAARHDPRLRRQVVVTVLTSVIPTVTLLAVGAAAGAPGQRWIWLAAVLYDFAAVFVSANTSRGWVIQSAAHFAERHALVVILALGESIVSIAAGLGGAHLSWHIVVGAVLSILIAVGLYFAYFDHLVDRLEQAMDAVQGQARAKLGTDIFTYLHFPIIAGVIVSALGIEQAMGHLDDHHLGALGGWALGGGVALFLAGTAATVLRCYGEWSATRLGAGLLLVALSPLLTVVHPLAAVGLVAVVVLVLAVAESARFAGPSPAQ